VTNALAAAKKKFQRLDAVVNCAGIGIAVQTYNFNKGLSHDLTEFEKVLKVCAFTEDMFLV